MSTITSFAFVDDNDTSNSTPTTPAPAAPNSTVQQTDQRSSRLSHLSYRMWRCRVAVRRWLVRHHIYPEFPHFYRLVYLTEWMQVAGYDRLDLSMKAIMPRPYLWMLEHGWPTTIYTAMRIADVFGIDSDLLHRYSYADMRDRYEHRKPGEYLPSSNHSFSEEDRYNAGWLAPVPTTRIQAVETTPGEPAFYMPHLFIHCPCGENGEAWEDVVREDMVIEPKLLKLMEACNLSLEEVLKIVYCETPAPLATAVVIAKTLDVNLLQIIEY